MTRNIQALILNILVRERERDFTGKAEKKKFTITMKSLIFFVAQLSLETHHPHVNTATCKPCKQQIYILTNRSTVDYPRLKAFKMLSH